MTQQLFAQPEVLSVSGQYYNENIFIYNPTVGDNFSIQSLRINDTEVSSDFSSNGIELDLGSYNLKKENPIIISIVYDSAHPPVIINPEAIMPLESFRISKPRYLKNNKLRLSIQGVPRNTPIIVEQYKWDTWREVASVNSNEPVDKNTYEVKINPHSGKNIYRVKSTNVKGTEIISRSCIFSPKNVQNISIQKKISSKEIQFSAKTEYEIYTLEEKLVLNGNDRYIDISSLKKGKYLLFFDNKVIQFKKKK